DGADVAQPGTVARQRQPVVRRVLRVVVRAQVHARTGQRHRHSPGNLPTDQVELYEPVQVGQLRVHRLLVRGDDRERVRVHDGELAGTLDRFEELRQRGHADARVVDARTVGREVVLVRVRPG